MAIPTSAPWILANFDETTISSLLGLGPGDFSLVPSGAPYWTFDAPGNFVRLLSDDGTAVTGDMNVPIPNRATVELVVRFPRLPDDHGTVADHRVGVTLADDSSRGISIYFAKTGIAISRVDDFGSVAPIPGTADLVREVDTFFTRIRIAVDAASGIAYLFIADARDAFPPVEAIVPIEQTPLGVPDTFQFFARGTTTQPVQVEYATIRLGPDLIIPNFPPTASAGPDRVVVAGQAARLNGRASFDVEGAQLSYTWRAIDAPFGSTYAHDNSGGTSTDDGDADGFTNTLTFTALSLPAWVAAGDVLRIAGTRHVIATVDNVGGALTTVGDTIPDAFSGQPFRVIRQSVVVGGDTETPVVVPDIQGLYRFVLVVNDGENDSDESEVLVSVVGARAPFGIEPDVGFIWNGLGDDWKSVENREVFTEAWRGAAQILGSKLLEAWQYHYNFSIRDAQRTFQKKWLAYRTLIAETSPDETVISPRYGVFLATHDFGTSNPAVTGLTLVIEHATDGGAESTDTVTTTFSADDLTTIVADLTAALAGTDIEAADISGTTLRLRSLSRGFRILSTSTAAGILGLPVDDYAHLSGTQGALVTTRTYRVEDGINLNDHGVVRGDLLILNNGQSFRVDRVLDNPSDPTRYQRVLTFEDLPADASPEWDIPSVILSAEVDYETEGSYPGDLVKAEIFDVSDSSTTDVRGTVVAQRGYQVAAHLDGFYSAFLAEKFQLRLLGIKRRKAIRIDQEIRSIPQLQDVIPQRQNPTLWMENIDYYLEPFYRDIYEAPISMLQFRDEVFIDPDLEPPDILWAELTLFSNEQNVENTFGRLVGFLRDDASAFGDDFNYTAGVAGLLYANLTGPSVAAIKTGAQILFGQPFAEVKGIILEIRNDFSPTSGRILIQDDDGNDPPRTDVVRSYVYTKDPLDETSASGLEVNPATGVPYAAGDTVEQFAPIAAGVRIIDYLNDPNWYVPFVRSGLFTEIEKYFQFLTEFNLDLVSVANLALAQQFVLDVKPTYTYPILLGVKTLEDDVDITDTLDMVIDIGLFDTFCVSGRAFMYDDYRGDGSIWSTYGDGATYYDGIVDCVSDYIEVTLETVWAGGIITYGSIFAYDVEVVDVDGTLGPPGGTFIPTYDQNLPAGTYQVILVLDAGNDIIP